MNTSTISLSDLVKVDRRGREFIAEVTAKEPNGDLQLRPLQRSTYYSARPREVVAHYRAMGRPQILRQSRPETYCARTSTVPRPTAWSTAGCTSHPASFTKCPLRRSGRAGRSRSPTPTFASATAASVDAAHKRTPRIRAAHG
jgi:hypothetical protein